MGALFGHLSDISPGMKKLLDDDDLSLDCPRSLRYLLHHVLSGAPYPGHRTIRLYALTVYLTDLISTEIIYYAFCSFSNTDRLYVWRHSS